MGPFLSVFVENSWTSHWTGSDWLILLSISPCSTHMYQWCHMLHHQKFLNVDHHGHGIFLPILERSRHNLDGLWRLVKKSQKKTDFKTCPPNPAWVLITLRSLSRHIQMARKWIHHCHIGIPCHSEQTVFFTSEFTDSSTNDKSVMVRLSLPIAILNPYTWFDFTIFTFWFWFDAVITIKIPTIFANTHARHGFWR